MSDTHDGSRTRSRGRSARVSTTAFRSAVVLISIGAGAVTALAGIVAVGGDAVLFTPDDVTQDQNESDVSIAVFEEEQCILLTEDLVTDQGVIPAGTSVSCHMARADPNGGVVLDGTILFDAPILGVISSSALLDDSDDPCGLAGTTYPAAGAEPNRGLEGLQASDRYRRNGDCGLQVQMDVPNFQDQVRVITECCKEANCCGD